MKKRRTAKKNRYLAFYLIAFAVVGLGVFTLMSFMFFKVEFIKVNETSKYTNEEILSSIGIEKGENLVFLNTAEKEKNILETFPYVDSVKITKSLPSTVNIKVEEAQPFYSVAFKDDYVLVSAKGKLLERTNAPLEGTANIIAGTIRDEGGYMKFENEKMGDYLKQIMGFIATREHGEITLIDFSNIYDMKIVYDDRIEMSLGSAVDLEYKLRFGFQIIDGGNILENDTGKLDLSFSRDANKAFLNIDAKDKIPDIETEIPNPEGTEPPTDPETSATPKPVATPSIDSNRGDDIPDV